MQTKTMELRWPSKGVVRRNSLRAAPDGRGPYPSPWSVNVRLEDPLDRRLRGGTRPGLTKFVADDLGDAIADMVSINTSSASGGASEILFVLVDSAVKTVENGVTSSPVAYLTNEAGDVLTDEDENRLTISTGTVPASGFLVTGKQKVFAVTTSAIVEIDPKTGQVDNLAATAGAIPTGCTFGAVYRDRLCLAGYDNAIYMSRQGNYGDWNYGAHFEDAGRAVPFQLALGADVGAKPTAMIPVQDDFLLCATARSLWVVRGDPTTGGLNRISETVGIIGSKAWCRVDGTIVFLAEDGLYQINADGSGLKALSPDTVPAELRDVNVSTTTVSIGYEADKLAYHVYLRTSGGGDTHWLYELTPQAFWPMRLQDDHSPRAVCQHKGELLLAGGDGYVRKASGTTDDGTAIASHVAIGPLRIGAPGGFGRIQRLYGVTAAGSASVTWRIVLGNSAEEAADNAKLAIEAALAGNSFSAYVHSSGTWSAGINNSAYPRARGMWAVLWLSCSGQFAYEGASLDSIQSGKWRGA